MTISPKFEVIDGQPFVLLVSDRNADQVIHLPYDELNMFVEKLRQIRAKKRHDDMRNETPEQKVLAIYDNMDEITKLHITDEFRAQVAQARVTDRPKEYVGAWVDIDCVNQLKNKIAGSLGVANHLISSDELNVNQYNGIEIKNR